MLEEKLWIIEIEALEEPPEQLACCEMCWLLNALCSNQKHVLLDKKGDMSYSLGDTND